MSLINEETKKEYEKLFKNSIIDEEVISLALLELVKQLKRQNELLNILQSNVKEVSLNLETIEGRLDYLSDIYDTLEHLGDIKYKMGYLSDINNTLGSLCYTIDKRE